jgi:L-asparaginase II
MTNPVLVEVTRGPRIESRHRGAIAIIDVAGSRVASIGDIETPVFPRSAVKPIQALPFVESGAADAYRFSNAELALACASHGGEPRHVEGVAAMLAAAGLDESALECGASWPANEDARIALARSGARPSAVHDNCSGKHAGFLVTARHSGWDTRGYVAHDHPVQERVRQVLEDLTGATLDDSVRGVDGCSIPTYGIPLKKLAHGFARFVTGTGLSAERASAARRLVRACQSEPFLVAGTGRFDTDAMALFGVRLLVKVGGEGVFCAGFPELGLGAAIKCDDGAGRGAEVMMATVIAALLKPTEAELKEFERRLHPAVVTRRGARIGEARPSVELEEIRLQLPH